ncbi:MAG: inositol monophosphatase family protein [Rhodospirillaceae bacterium]|nr:inositol monophosphatase family protein [Rhodospirillaceae bacterium]
MPPRSALINVMVAAAEKTARALKRDFGEVEQLQVSRKGPGDFVSAADVRAEKQLVAELSKARPNFGFVLEEGGVIAGADPDQRWIIDPIDGTTNFLHGIPHFAMSIALQQGEAIVAGVILNPATDDLFVAEKGQGAFLNNRRLRVSARTRLDDAVIATGIPHGDRVTGDRRAMYLRQLERVMGATAGVRRAGTASLDLAYVAAGRYDGFWELSLKPWDIAAGILLVREAGGFVTDLAGPGDALLTGNILAANADLHEPLRALLAGA